jgi:hypothetical protein
VRTVRHPIALFVIVVLVVIGIGVGVVAATTNQRVFGPSWGSFTAAFTGHVYQTQERSKVRVSGGLTLTVTSFSYSNQPHFGWYAYAPGSGGVFAAYDQYSVSVAEGMSMRLVVEGDRKNFFRPGVTEGEQVTSGVSVATIGPQCADGECNAAKVVSSGRVVWNVEAFWDGPVSTVKGFLASFEPLG